MPYHQNDRRRQQPVANQKLIGVGCYLGIIGKVQIRIAQDRPARLLDLMGQCIIIGEQGAMKDEVLFYPFRSRDSSPQNSSLLNP